LALLIIFIEVFARLSYNNWGYDFGPGNMRTERGIIWKHYSNIPYERVQNVDIHRGIFARMFGFSTLQVQTAGFSGSPMSEGHIPGVSTKEAEEIREFLLKKITHRSKAGL
jgi:putative membrane protein